LHGAVQFQDFRTPSYSESDLTGGGFGLSYASMNARSDVALQQTAHSVRPPRVGSARQARCVVGLLTKSCALSAAFEALPGGTFSVNGAPIPENSPLVSAGAELFLAPNWSLLAKFDGEFGNGSQTYAGSGVVRYTW
jgi:uncharacterized protein with beta-barrel porin domain